MKVYRPVIKDKLKTILLSHEYNFCGMTFTIYNKDEIRIYDNQEDLNLLYKDEISTVYSTIPKELLNSEYCVETLERFEEHQFAVCFYLKRKKEKIEAPINAGVRFI